MLKKLACMVLLVSTVSDAATLSDAATATAQYARATYGTRVVDTLAALVSCEEQLLLNLQMYTAALVELAR